MVANLLDNAVRFTERGEVKLTLSERFLKVKDSGRGIDEEIKGRLFEKFVKGRESCGEGIGLSVVKEIAQLHGWRITFESSEKGSVFTVLF